MARGRTAPAQPQEQGTTESQGQEQQASAPEKVDLTEFKSAVEAAVAERDSSTGDLPTARVEAVKAAYRQLPGGAAAKREAKQYLADGMKAGMDALDIQTARAFDQLIREAAVAGGATSAKAPADPTEAHVSLVVLLDLARTLPEPPEGVAQDWQDRAEKRYAELAPQLDTYRNWVNGDEATRGDEPQVDELVKQAVRLQSGRKGRKSGGGTPFTGQRGDILKHIQSAFADKESGTFLTVSEIVAHRSEEYGDRKPSPGAVLARIFPKSGQPSQEVLAVVTPDTNDKGVRGARKV